MKHTGFLKKSNRTLCIKNIKMKGAKMKKILIGILALGSIATFAQNQTIKELSREKQEILAKVKKNLARVKKIDKQILDLHKTDHKSAEHRNTYVFPSFEDAQIDSARKIVESKSSEIVDNLVVLLYGDSFTVQEYLYRWNTSTNDFANRSTIIWFPAADESSPMPDNLVARLGLKYNLDDSLIGGGLKLDRTNPIACGGARSREINFVVPDDKPGGWINVCLLLSSVRNTKH